MSCELDTAAIEQKALGQLQTKLGVKARTLKAGMKRAGRRLPKGAHRAAEVICTAHLHGAHPKLARMIDGAAVAHAERTLHAHLDKIDPKKRRADALLSLAGAQAFNVLAVFVLVIALMRWRGLL